MNVADEYESNINLEPMCDTDSDIDLESDSGSNNNLFGFMFKEK